jgi:hypothetical protein
MKSTNAAQSTQTARREASNLEVRYGKIGISAVVAAMRYQGDAKDPAPAVVRQPDRRLPELVPGIAA